MISQNQRLKSNLDLPPLAEVQKDHQCFRRQRTRVLVWLKKSSQNLERLKTQLGKVVGMKLLILVRRIRQTLVSLERWLSKEMVHKSPRKQAPSLSFPVKQNSKQDRMKNLKLIVVKIMTTLAWKWPLLPPNHSSKKKAKVKSKWEMDNPRIIAVEAVDSKRAAPFPKNKTAMTMALRWSQTRSAWTNVKMTVMIATNKTEAASEETLDREEVPEEASHAEWPTVRVCFQGISQLNLTPKELQT